MSADSFSPRHRAVVVVVISASLLMGALSGCGGGGDSTISSTSSEAPTATEPPRSPDAELVPITSIDESTCFDTQVEASSLTRAVWTVPCSDPHDYELYDIIEYEGAGDYRHPEYPGEQAVQDQAEQRCYDGFEPFTGIRWTISALDIRTWWPTEVSWSEGDRTILCAVTSTDGTRLTGSQEQSRR